MSVHIKTNSFNARFKSKSRAALKAKAYTPLIDYKEIKEQARVHSYSLLKLWLPNGIVRQHEYIALNPTRHDQHLGSFRINMHSGQWADFATSDRGGDLIALLAYLDQSTQSKAARKISALLGLKEHRHVG
ncbi:hypothetical protein [Commensalibacter papalotli (ex Botero et al. 2024)]|nr:hypothetical protein [Commensalibacter papalotli (ex Botero et al. 2024)]CAI3949663.1 DNA primase [Commensalibacter papalotli (ex Botero et al. 2024)]